jgi:ubiquinone/menaquinone biosynthesis C-methylase UbiE
LVLIESIIKKEYRSHLGDDDQGAYYDFTQESEQSSFYDKLFSDERPDNDRSLLYDKKPTAIRLEQEGIRNINTVVSFLKGMLQKDSVIIEIGGGIHQKRSGYIYKEFINYYPLDISRSSIRKYVDKYNRPGVVADASNLPFEDSSVDAIFTHTFLEHTTDPQKILEEIARVLKPGGVVIHLDAWFCRWWHRFGVVGLKRFNEMSVKEKLISIAAKVTEWKPLRFPPILLRRMMRLTLLDLRSPVSLAYRKLNPNYDLFLGCDEDAASSIDPVDVMIFYHSRGFESMEALNFQKKLFYRLPFILLRKKQ